MIAATTVVRLKALWCFIRARIAVTGWAVAVHLCQVSFTLLYSVEAHIARLATVEIEVHYLIRDIAHHTDDMRKHPTEWEYVFTHARATAIKAKQIMALARRQLTDAQLSLFEEVEE